MMTYMRVIPRDLFNESKLLKCLGQLSLIAHDGLDCRRQRVERLIVEFEEGLEGDPFMIEQNEMSGALYCRTLRVEVNGRLVSVASTYNSKSPFPLCFGDNEEPVFNDDGSLSDEFLAFAERVRCEAT